MTNCRRRIDECHIVLHLRLHTFSDPFEYCIAISFLATERERRIGNISHLRKLL